VASGSSAANLNLARVIEVDPLVETTEGWFYASKLSVSPSKRGLSVTYPRRRVLHPIERNIDDERWHFVDDPSKAYRLVIKRIREGQDAVGALWPDDNPDRKVTLTNVNRVVVVTSLYTPRREDPTHE
jgi:hypothetical protein